MQQQISCVTLSVEGLSRSRRFYVEGFGWTPVFEHDEIIFYQMNGLMLGTWLAPNLQHDLQQPALPGHGAFSLAHNVTSGDQVQALLDRLAQYGGRILRQADAPSYGGLRGYVADPDGHAWEIAFNPSWPISPEGYVRFSA